MPADDLITVDARGLYCPPGGFHIDPRLPAERAVITHAHADHAVPGSAAYLTAGPGAAILRLRLGDGAPVTAVAYGERLRIGEVTVSLHPAGHLLGSAQVRLEWRGRVWVVSGDYKLQADPTCAPFEALPCQVFLSESTFALPIYRWQAPGETIGAIEAWWRGNQAVGRTSVLFAYALGKAQRILAAIDPGIGPLIAHGAVLRFLPAYAAAGVALPTVHRVEEVADAGRGRALVIAPPSAAGSPWLRRFGDSATAFASGWMQVRGARRRRNLDRGFALSDHADWDGLHSAIRATGAERVLVTHGQVPTLVRWLGENGWQAEALHAHHAGELEGEGDPARAGAAHAPRDEG